MKALGFSEKWIQLVMACVTVRTFALLINDQAHGMVIPQRGLRYAKNLISCRDGTNLKFDQLLGCNHERSMEEKPSFSHYSQWVLSNLRMIQRVECESS